jgi:hypothetical protein|nr:MAG TPA: hypothetical protein [Caudoviricetes sp.]
MLLNKHKAQEIVESVTITRQDIKAYMRLMHLSYNPHIATFAIFVVGIFRNKITDKISELQ